VLRIGLPLSWAGPLVHTDLAYPLAAVHIARKVEEPAKDGHAIASPETAGRCSPSEDADELAWSRMAPAECICYDVRYRFRIFPGPEQVTCYARGSCEKETIQAGPFAVMDLPQMDPHVRAARLAPDGHRELVLIRWKVPQLVHGRR
jgi:hypothetical protein